jgi:hypothetical protein
LLVLLLAAVVVVAFAGGDVPDGEPASEQDQERDYGSGHERHCPGYEEATPRRRRGLR